MHYYTPRNSLRVGHEDAEDLGDHSVVLGCQVGALKPSPQEQSVSSRRIRAYNSKTVKGHATLLVSYVEVPRRTFCLRFRTTWVRKKSCSEKLKTRSSRRPAAHREHVGEACALLHGGNGVDYTPAISLSETHLIRSDLEEDTTHNTQPKHRDGERVDASPSTALHAINVSLQCAGGHCTPRIVTQCTNKETMTTASHKAYSKTNYTI